MANQGNIAVDIGNSFIKSAKFVDDELTDKQVWNDLTELKGHYADAEYRWIFSSVNNKDEEIQQLFATVDYLILTPQTPIPLQVDYATPQTLGMDRLAAAVGAAHLYPEKPVLIIDAGSCIKYDLVNAGVFLGGTIAPGLKMRMKAMHYYTKRLPDISDEWQKLTINSPGKSTKECLVNGAFVGMLHEISGFIKQYLKEYEDLAVILSGGDAIHFESKIKPPIFANLNLVLIGLNRILNHNK